MVFAVMGLVGIVAVVTAQVFGRYVLNDTPVWAESTALVLVLYVTLLGAAVGVRDAGHIGMESLLGARARSHPQPHGAGDSRAGRGLRRDHGLERRNPRRLGRALQDPHARISEAFNQAPLVISGR